MSAIICFDVRNFTTHTSHHSSENKSVLFKVIEDIFNCLVKAINDSRTKIGIRSHRGPVNKFKYHPRHPVTSSMYGFLGLALNLSNRVQESTKDHTFKIICTEHVFKDAISIINDQHWETIKEYFTKLDKHKFRGLKKPITLYGVQIDFAKKFDSYM